MVSQHIFMVSQNIFNKNQIFAGNLEIFSRSGFKYNYFKPGGTKSRFVELYSPLPEVCEPVVGRGLCPLDDHVEGLHGLQLQHDFVQGPNRLGPPQVQNNALTVVQYLDGREGLLYTPI